VILQDGIKTIQNEVFTLSLKKEQNLVSFYKKTTKKQVGCLFFENFSTLVSIKS